MEKKNNNPEVFKLPLLILYLVHSVKKRNSHFLGRTKIQKLMYLFSLEINEDYNYTLHLFGPYSSYIESELNHAKNMSLIDENYYGDGYDYRSNDEQNEYLRYLSDKEKKLLDCISKKYSNFSAKELTVITTAIYIKNNFKEEDNNIVEEVYKLKKKDFSKDKIKEILKSKKIINTES